MTLQRWMLWLACSCIITALVGCGGGSSSGGGGNGGGGTPISVAFSTAPPATLQANKSASVAANVSNDSSNAGVDWSCAPSGSCGSFSPAHTASGASTSYTAPAAVPSGGKATITATSTADATKSASGSTTITVPTVAFNPALPSSLSVNQPQQLTAVVTGDGTNAGVDWTVSCGAADCGSFNPAHTASGGHTTYTAPAGATTARIKAAATADSSQFAAGNVTIFGVGISFYPQPTPSLLLADPNPAPLTAVVQHDVTNAGVDWTCTGAAGVCGTFAAHTAYNASNSYTVGASAGAATITATSTADPTQTVTAIITSSSTFGDSTIGMTGGDNYVYQLSGIDANGPYQLTGVFTADGAGNITGGEQHYSNTQNVYIDAIQATGSSYTINADGRGTITLNTGDTHIGPAGNGIETLGLVVIDGTRGLITQFDTSATSSGTLDLQTPKLQPSGAYAFVTSGVNLAATPKPLCFGGIINIDGPGTISGAGSVADDLDNMSQNLFQYLKGTVVSPDPMGKAVFHLNTAFTTQDLALVAYMIDNTHMKLVENDFYGNTSGVAFGQGSAAGKFTSGSFNDTVVFETSGLSTSSFVPTVFAGLFTAGSGSINGVADGNAGGTPLSDATLTGNYSVAASGRVTTSNMEFNGLASSGPTWILYLTNDASTPALILQVDTAPIETAGAAYTQTGGPFGLGSFSGTYAMGFSAFPSGAGEDDGTGRVSAITGNLGTPYGTVDINYDLTTQETDTLTGTYTAPDHSGRLPGTLTTSGPAFNASQTVFYVVDTTHAIFIDTDPSQNQPALGVFQLQEQGNACVCH